MGPQQPPPRRIRTPGSLPVLPTNGTGHVVAERRIEPFEFGTLVLCLLYGTVGLAWYERLEMRTIKLYPFLGGRVFLALLAIGSATALIGIIRNTVKGLRLERAGLWLLVYLGASYAVWTPFAVGWSGLSLLLFFGIMLFVPGAWVARRRGRLIKDVERAISAAHERPEGAPDAPV